ncbi:unnamed protein product [Adineta steineri]|uniref:Uncharacterized protein n=1 Tax=Adineta steineri TaxID=433720 RepID=A0A815QGH5_9BILA|nr:unnamed protein product [Adineta steineri]CAF4074618.1 unnamed protein product [Adineta steineri]
MFHIEWKEVGQDNEKNDKNSNATTTNTPVQSFIERTSQLATTTIIVTAPERARQSSPKKKLLILYTKIIDGDKVQNIVFLVVIITLVFGTACMAFVQGCFLANITLYPDGPCPRYGIMDCYAGAGNNDIHFNCAPGLQANSTQFNNSATCFRWIVRDMSINDVVTQFGACTGLLHALCAIVQLALRFLIYSMSKRVQTSNEEQEENAARSTADIRSPSAQNKEGKENNEIIYTQENSNRLLCRCICIGIFIISPLVAVALFSCYKISTTALTYIILLTVTLVSVIAFLWVVDTEVDNVEDTQLAAIVRDHLKTQTSEENKNEKNKISQIIKGLKKEDLETLFYEILNK